MLVLHGWRSRQRDNLADRLPLLDVVHSSNGCNGGFCHREYFNAAGPVMVIYLTAIGLPKLVFIGTGAWFFLLVNASQSASSSANLGLITPDSLVMDAVLVLPLIPGALLGPRILNHINQAAFGENGCPPSPSPGRCGFCGRPERGNSTGVNGGNGRIYPTSLHAPAGRRGPGRGRFPFTTGGKSQVADFAPKMLLRNDISLRSASYGRVIRKIPIQHEYEQARTEFMDKCALRSPISTPQRLLLVRWGLFVLGMWCVIGIVAGCAMPKRILENAPTPFSVAPKHPILPSRAKFGSADCRDLPRASERRRVLVRPSR